MSAGMVSVGGRLAWPLCCGPMDALELQAQEVRVEPAIEEGKVSESYPTILGQRPPKRLSYDSPAENDFVHYLDSAKTHGSLKTCSTSSGFEGGLTRVSTFEMTCSTRSTLEETSEQKSEENELRPLPIELLRAESYDSMDSRLSIRFSSRESVDEEGGHPRRMHTKSLREKVGRAKRVGRRLTSQITTRFTGIYRQKSTLGAACKSLPAGPISPEGLGEPIFTERITEVSMDQVRGALASDESCPLHRFMREALGFYDMMATGWRDCSQTENVRVRKTCYTMVVPPDVPAAVRRLCNIPDTLCGSTLVRMHDNGEDVQLLQQSYTHDVLYGDCFKVHNLLSFCEEPAGGIVIKQWVATVWEKPLPWTHGFVKLFVERKVRADATHNAPRFGEALRASVGRGAGKGGQGDDGSCEA
mmetsp:Transcript_11189/g.29798  ORF Transcript_11189/g.29798 Transcript_11189/m.29798 type:complete len:416 (+) Transcript_11189:74-1321(+)